MRFKDFIQESSEKHAVLAFGRMNPPTTGHAKLVDKVKEVAQKVGGSHHVVLSHSQDSKKNPLSAKDKLKHAKRFFSNTNLSVSDKEHPTFLHHAAKLHKQGVTHLHMVAGSDRADEYKKKLKQYNGTHEGALYNFKKITVHSSGERDPDAEGTEGMSASKMRSHASTGNYKEFKKGIPSHVAEHHAKELYSDVRKHMGIKESLDDIFEEILIEGVHDKGIFKAVFLAGGPGSGKDYVLDNTLSGHGLTEINSDKALEFLMDKEGLDKTMPKEEQEARDFVRGKAKNMTELRQRLALQGRNGLIINGTGDDGEKIKKIKEKLEGMGYDTHMVVVNTADEVSAARNVERGQRGGRTVPEKIRKQKWQAVQDARPELAKMFGPNYVEFDNSEDLRNASPEVVQAKKDEMLNIYKGIQKFVKSPPKSDMAKMWVAHELEKKDTLPPITGKSSEVTPHSSSAAAEEAKKLGLEYYGFGRYGKDNKVTYRSVHDKLQSVQNVNEEFEQFLEEAVSITVSGDTVEEVKQAMKLLTSNEEDELEEQDNPLKMEFTSSDAKKLLTLGKITEGHILTEASKPTSLDKFRAAAAEREKEYKKREAEMKARHAQGKEDMSGAIDKLSQRLNKESTLTPAEERGGADKHYGRKYNNPHPTGSQEHQAYHKGYHGTDSEKDYGVSKGKPQHKFESVEQIDELSINKLQNYKSKAAQDGIYRMKTGSGGGLDRLHGMMKASQKISMKAKQNAMLGQITANEEVIEESKNLLKDNGGKVRVFMLRRAAAKEAHVKGGVVHKQGNGYVIKLKENENVSIINQSIQEERSRSSTRISGSGITEERSCGAIQEQSGKFGRGSGETEEASSKGKISISQIRSKQKEKINEIDRGIEPGISMASAGENSSRAGNVKTKQMKKPFEEAIGAGGEDVSSNSDKKEDELKKVGINLLSFKSKKFIG